jgi:hypothetical protein
MNPLWFLAGIATGWVLLGLWPRLRPVAEELEAAGSAVYKQLQALAASPASEPTRSRSRRKAGAATSGRRSRRPASTATRTRRLRVATRGDAQNAPTRSHPSTVA